MLFKSLFHEVKRRARSGLAAEDGKAEILVKPYGVHVFRRDVQPNLFAAEHLVICYRTADQLRSERNKLSKQIGALMGQAKKDPSKAAEAEEIKKQVTAQADRLKELEAKVGFAARYRRVQEKLEELEQLVIDARFECTGPYAKLTTTEYAATLTKMLGIIRSMDEVNES